MTTDPTAVLAELAAKLKAVAPAPWGWIPGYGISSDHLRKKGLTTLSIDAYDYACPDGYDDEDEPCELCEEGKSHPVPCDQPTAAMVIALRNAGDALVRIALAAHVVADWWGTPQGFQDMGVDNAKFAELRLALSALAEEKHGS